MAKKSAVVEPIIESELDHDVPSLWKIAHECIEEAGDWSGGAKLMTEQVKADKALFDALARQRFDVGKACWELCRQVGKSGRQAYWQREPDGQDRIVQDGGITMLAKSNLLDYPLMNGVRLGDADDATLEANIVIMETRGRTMMTRALWLRLVKQAKEDAKTVEQALTHAQLEALQRQAEEAMAA